MRRIKDRRTQKAIANGLERLETEPAKRGKELKKDLQGYYSIRLAGQRYRAIYSVVVSEGEVEVLVIGIRKERDKRDVYEVGKKRLR